MQNVTTNRKATTASHYRPRCLVLAVWIAVATTCLGQTGHRRITSLPAIYIEVYYGHNIIKDLYRIARMWYIDEEDNVVFSDSLMMAGRGNSTWSFDKKPYKLRLKRPLAMIPGKAASRRWILLANAADKTMLRNAVASRAGEQTSLPFNPSYRFVDFVINGDYQGTYQLTEAIEIAPGRVDITPQRIPPLPDDDLSGGYLLEIDGTQDGNCFTTDRCHVPIRIHEPDDDNINMAQQTYITSVVNEFECRLMDDDFCDCARGYRPLVDTLQIADWYICQELTGNGDAFHNTFFYKEQGDDRLHFGPLWDYDIAFGNDNRLGDTTHELMADIGYGAARQWIVRLWQDPWFARLINRRYNELLEQGIVERLTTAIDSLAAAIDASQQLNYALWSIDEQVYLERVLHTTYSAYVDDLKEYIAQHALFLKEAFRQRQESAGTTGIAMTRRQTEHPAPVVDLTGKLVSDTKNLPKGVYIANGQKWVVR